ncbi:MAG: hypothetical protein HQM16_13850 [Deltaproteobacteria bacterium]|nr:hypothetical protein [Deltaproteobacteria bacterium]
MSRQIKLEVSPAYMEMGECPEISGKQRKEVYYLRNAIKRCQDGLLPGEDENNLWDRLKDILCSP